MNALVSLPIAASVAIASPNDATIASQDSELLAIGHEFEALAADYNAAFKLTNELLEVYDSRIPQKPDMLLRKHPAKGNRFPWIGSSDGKYYGLDSIECFRSVPSIANDLWGDRAEAARIVAAADAWSVECLQVRDSCGLVASEATEERLYQEIHVLVDRISEFSASTIAGLKIKALAADWCRDWGRDETMESVLISITSDLASIAA